MSDSTEPREGWYVATTNRETIGIVEKKYNIKDGHFWIIHSGASNCYAPDSLPHGWTLGPRIDDLLRDADRYRWLRDCRAYPFGGTDWDDLDSLIDAEIAREDGR